jgi:hypothetical protein
MGSHYDYNIDPYIHITTSSYNLWPQIVTTGSYMDKWINIVSIMGSH